MSEVALVRKSDPVRRARNTIDKSAEVFSRAQRDGKFGPHVDAERACLSWQSREHWSQPSANHISVLISSQPMGLTAESHQLQSQSVSVCKVA